LKALETPHQPPTRIPSPSPRDPRLLGAGLAALLLLPLPPAPKVGGKGSGVKGGGAGGPRPTTGIPRSSAGSEVRELKALLPGREGFRERIGGVNERFMPEVGREACFGLDKVVSKGAGLVLARIWMLMGRLAEAGW
jgi:hypothetical protein